MLANYKVKLSLTTAFVAAVNVAGIPSVSAQTYGVHHTATETLTIENPDGQTIEGLKSGIFGQEGAVILNNAGTIIGHGSYDGFAAEPDSGVVLAVGPSSIVNSGTIAGAGTGVGTAYYYDPVTDSIVPRAIGTTVVNSGTISGQFNDGIRLIGGGTVTNSGSIEGLVGPSTDGISMFAYVGQDTSGQESIGSIANAAGGTISGPRFGIILSGGGVIENAGAIDGGAGAILIQASLGEVGKTATVTNSGTLTGGDAISFAGDLSASSLVNSGTVRAAGAYGVHNAAPGTLTITNEAGGVIEGAKSGIFGQEGAVVINNAGTIIGHGSYDGFAAEPDSGIVLAVGPSSVVNSGTIRGAGAGISTSHYYDAATNSLLPRAVGTTVENSGTITGESNDGVRLIGGGEIKAKLTLTVTGATTNAKAAVEGAGGKVTVLILPKAEQPPRVRKGKRVGKNAKAAAAAPSAQA